MPITEDLERTIQKARERHTHQDRYFETLEKIRRFMREIRKTTIGPFEVQDCFSKPFKKGKIMDYKEHLLFYVGSDEFYRLDDISEAKKLLLKEEERSKSPCLISLMNERLYSTVLRAYEFC